MQRHDEAGSSGAHIDSALVSPQSSLWPGCVVDMDTTRSDALTMTSGRNSVTADEESPASASFSPPPAAACPVDPGGGAVVADGDA